MYELTVSSSSGDYAVNIGPGTFAAVVPDGDVCFVADRRFESLVGGPAAWVDADEEHKTVGYAERLMEQLAAAGVRRDTTLVAVGGGVVQDLATLVASLYMRGLEWRYAPTTLMAMADSCIGGKSSLNVGGFKNLAGNFHPPQAIAVDPTFLETLPETDLVAGLGECAKIAFCRGPESFARYVALQTPLRSGDRGAASALLHHVLDAKRWFIEVDEFDHAERRQLNFGHTFGHALEAATGFALPHGVAVILGMRCAIRLAPEPSLASALDSHCAELLAGVSDLGKRLADLDRERFWQAFHADKKHRSGELHLILPASGGATHEVPLPDDGATRRAVLDAVEAVVA